MLVHFITINVFIYAATVLQFEMQSYNTSESEGVAEICLVVNFPIQVPLSIEVTIHQDEMSES